MDSGNYLIQLLYLIVYSGSLIILAAVIVFRKRMGTKPDKTLKQLLAAAAFCPALFSLQVFINAVGLTGSLQKPEAQEVILALNTLIIISITVLVRAALITSFSLRSGIIGNKVRISATAATAAVLVIYCILQFFTLSESSLKAAVILNLLTLAGTGILYACIIFSTIRLFLPCRLGTDPPVLYPFRTLLLFLCIFPVAFLVAGNIIGTVIAPAGFLVMNIFSIRLVAARLRKPDHVTAENEEQNGNNSSFDPLSVCREIGLSKRESEVALLLASGMTYKEIAAELYISMSTTQTHAGRIYSKLGINNKTELSNLIYYKKR